MNLYSRKETVSAAKVNFAGALCVLGWLAVASVMLDALKEQIALKLVILVVWLAVGFVGYLAYKRKHRELLNHTSQANITKFNLSALYHLITKREQDK